MQATTLSEAAADLLKRRLAGERVEVTEENRSLYRELVTAGLAIPLHSFARGNEGHFRLTEAACALREA
ncbi:hypothetical protein [Tautonia plasticadhaerens]|uniref:Uncharacterized protein n=1 Tax=Tautonia plasticadhaerens TaxID=2527974 RepID=A0A518H226_9BACT|nr:hypothetical protein [Tautonia plasticadhaerens]QDV34883.1 hypothetical protein ElP_27800 [Tautonia plasticadhaerens]